MRTRILVEPRATPAWYIKIVVVLLSLGAAAVAGGIVLRLAGNDPLEVYDVMLDSSVNGWLPFTRTLVGATPIILTGLAAAVAFRMKIWNIGAEGQLFMGAIAASGLALSLPTLLPKPLMLVLVLAGGAVAGAVWAGLAAVPKAYLNTDEVITTLMLNFIALSFMNYLIFGSVSFWRNPDAAFPQGKTIPDSAQLPIIANRLHYGFAVAIGLAALLWWVLRSSPWGFELRTIGDSPPAARFAGMWVKRKTLSVLALSGALAGLAGAIEISGVLKSLEPRSLTVELGFTGIVVAAAARLNPLGVVPIGVLLAALITSGPILQRVGVASTIVLFLQGLILLFVVAGEFFVANRVYVSVGSAAQPAGGHNE